MLGVGQALAVVPDAEKESLSEMLLSPWKTKKGESTYFGEEQLKQAGAKKGKEPDYNKLLDKAFHSKHVHPDKQINPKDVSKASVLDEVKKFLAPKFMKVRILGLFFAIDVTLSLCLC